MILALALGLALSQDPPAPIVWADPAPAAVEAEAPSAPPPPPIPDWARTNPYGYERAQCSPLIRSREESLQACQFRVRTVLAAHLGDALPHGLRPSGDMNACRNEPSGDGFAVRCDAPGRRVPETAAPRERRCETRPAVQPGGGVSWSEQCEPEGGERRDGLVIFRSGD